MDFVVGHPRSGTALVAAILNAGRERVAEHEWLAKLSSLSIAAATEYYEGRRSRNSIAALLEHYRYGDGTPVRIDSNWKLTWMLDVVLSEFPDARVLHLARNPVENIGACMSLDFYGDGTRRIDDLHARNYWLAWMPRIRGTDWGSYTQLEKNTAFWAETHRLIIRATGEHRRVMRTRLDRLDLNEAKRIRAFFGLPAIEDDTLRAVLDQRHNQRDAIRARLAGAAAADAPTNGPSRDDRAATLAVIRALAADVADRLGYGADLHARSPQGS